MVRSMTGYGKASALIDGREITVEIKSVNHRYFEFSSRVPRVYGYLEEKLKGYIQRRISRGKVDVGVTILTAEAGDAAVEINRTLAKGYVDALRGLADELGLVDDLSLSVISRLPDIFTVRKNEADEQVIWEGVQQVADQAVEKFVAMRTEEGNRLKEDILYRLCIIENTVAEIETRSPKRVEEYQNRLYHKLCEVLQNNNFDEQRILTEAAIFADRIAVDEETVRLKSHIEQFRQILTLAEPVGRKLDFLVQELNREANTIGSKCQDVAAARYVIDIKAQIEKIREQIQNIE